ncbi:MAG: flagellar filament capping protein FliD, partial [Burkholderiales bacterium]
VMPNATGAAKTLADLGLSTQRDGSFVLDTNRLKATLAKDPEGVAAMFTTGLYGVFATVDKLNRNASSASDPGSLGGSISRFTKQLAQVKVDQTGIAAKQETLRANLTARYAASDTRITASKSTLSFIQNQIEAWNNSGD